MTYCEKDNGNLLQTFRSTKSHTAVAVDEYSRTLGAVTMEGILEQLVDRIWDGHDPVEKPVHQISENTYKVDGSWNPDDFCTGFHLKNDSDIQTVGW